jgi:hypothetical protein
MATVALAAFAGVQIWREIGRQARAERAAAARISAIAYRLQRHIATILATEERGWRKPVQVWISIALGTHSFQSQLELLIGRAHAMMDLIGDADRHLANAVRRTFVLTLDACDRVQQLARMGEATIENAPEYTDLVNHATRDFEECAETLKARVIELWLQNEEGALRRAREERSFLASFDPAFKAMRDADAAAASEAGQQIDSPFAGEAAPLPRPTLGTRMRRAVETLMPRERVKRAGRDSGAYHDDESTGSE